MHVHVHVDEIINLAFLPSLVPPSPNYTTIVKYFVCKIFMYSVGQTDSILTNTKYIMLNIHKYLHVLGKVVDF